MINFTLEIDGKTVTVDKVLKGVKWSNIHVNGYSSCHSIPSHIIANNRTYKAISFKVNGHTYKVIK
jgi:phosphoribosylaminoimidazole (AIR) synthetase